MNYLDKTGLTRLWSKITSKLGQKQDTLVSGTTIKTINNQSILGSGNINVAVVIEADLSMNPNDYSISFDRWVTANPYNTVDTANQANIPVFAKMNIKYEGQTFLSNYMTQTMSNIGDEFKVFSGFFSDETISHVTMMLSESNENNPDLLFREVVYYEGEPHANIADETNTVTVQKFNEVLAVLRSIGAISSD